MQRRNYIALMSLYILIVIVFLPVTSVFILNMKGDYAAHISFIQMMEDTRQTQAPHFLFHLFTLGVKVGTGMSLDHAALTSIMSSYFLLGTILYYFFYSQLSIIFREQPILIETITIGVSFSLMLIAPVALLVSIDNYIYFGYIAVNVYHNPTIIFMKPLVVLLFVYSILPIFEKYSSNNLSKNIIIAIILITLSTLTKPNYTICLLPSLALWVVKKYDTLEFVNWKLLLYGILFPSIAMLGMQYLFTFGESANNKILFAPFNVMNHYSSWLLPKFILSVLFPLAVTLIYFQEAKKDEALKLAWLIFLFGAFYTYFLAESGQRMYHGNFLWSGQITLFILFVISTRFFISRIMDMNQSIEINCRIIFISITYFLHLLFGFVWLLFLPVETNLPW